MHSVSPLNGEGAVRASVRKMSGTEAGECAVSIVALYAEIMRLAEPLSRGKPLPVAEDAQVPPFLVKSVS